MKIVRDDGRVLVLAGVPNGAGWMIFAAFLGIAVGGPCVAGLYASLIDRSLPRAAAIPFSLGLLLGLIFLFFGLINLLSREQLSLDRAAGRGVYTLRIFPGRERRRTEFAIVDVHAVSLERFTVRSPSGRGFPRPALRARVLLANDRRKAIELDQTQNGRERRVRTIAAAVANFLSVQLRERDEEASGE